MSEFRAFIFLYLPKKECRKKVCKLSHLPHPSSKSLKCMKINPLYGIFDICQLACRLSFTSYPKLSGN